jgi:hypothetical protein
VDKPHTIINKPTSAPAAHLVELPGDTVEPTFQGRQQFRGG